MQWTFDGLYYGKAETQGRAFVLIGLPDNRWALYVGNEAIGEYRTLAMAERAAERWLKRNPCQR